MRQPFDSTSKEEEDQEINITPMLDVVFIMLIFFIVTATFVKEAGTEVTRPTATTAIPKQKASILIAITPEGKVWVDRKQVDLQSVRANIERLHAENPQGTVVIQADGKAKNDVLMGVLEAATAAGVTDVAVATDET